MRRVRTIGGKIREKVDSMLALCRKLVLRAEGGIAVLQERGIAHEQVLYYLEHAQRVDRSSG